jgi:hypothetical protein
MLNVLSHKTPQEVSQTSINNFSLTICLGMVCRVELEDSSKLSPALKRVMIGRGQLAGPCPALSYVERAISILTFFLKIKN